MIIDNDPLIERHISVPKDMSQLSCSSFTAGIVEAVLDGLGFVRRIVRHCFYTANPTPSLLGSQHTTHQQRSLHPGQLF